MEERDTVRRDRPLQVKLTELSDGRAVIFPNDTGHMPVPLVRLNPILECAVSTSDGWLTSGLRNVGTVDKNGGFLTRKVTAIASG